MKKIFFISLLCFSFSLTAMLPPFFHTAKEIEAIIADPRLHEACGSGQPIQSIVSTHNGYVVITPKVYVKIDVIYQPSDLVGSSAFELVFHKPISLESGEEVQTLQR